MARNIKKTYKSDAGFNYDTFPSKGGNIGNIDMSDFVTSGNIIGKVNYGKDKEPSKTRYKSKIKNQKEDGLLSKLYKALSTKSTSYDPTKAGLGGAKFAQRNEGGVMDKFTETDLKEAMKALNKVPLSRQARVLSNATENLKKQAKKDKISVSDIEAAMQLYRKKFGKKKTDFTQKNKGGLQEGLEKLKAKGLKDGSKDVVKKARTRGELKKKKKKKFPDLNKDGKVTFKDILIGRGVVKANKGTMVQARGCKIGRKKKTKIL
tara:strand:+ start:104 stop:892 length:789 start_codon:yes stop_codon:yes gene_type:complete